MPLLDVTFDLITPAFAGAADRAKTDGLRPPALKALLRYWWRVMHPDLPSKMLLQQEGELFGSTNGTVGHRFSLVPRTKWVKPKDRPTGTVMSNKRTRHPTVVYLGFGAVTFERGSSDNDYLLRTPQLNSGTILPATLRYNVASSSTEEVLHKVLWLVSAFGGYGARSRRGWGSLRLSGVDWSRWLAPDPHVGTAETLATRFSQGLKWIQATKSTTATPDHTALGAGARILLGGQKPTETDALDAIMNEFGKYRRALGGDYGHLSGCVGPDHRLRQSWLSTGVPASATTPLGSAFGLPHNSQFSSPGRGPKVNVGAGDGEGRRSSPLFFKVLRCDDGFVPLALWLPSLFLPVPPATTIPITASPEGKPSKTVGFGGDQAIKDFFDGNSAITCYEFRSTRGSSWNGLKKRGWTEVVW